MRRQSQVALGAGLVAITFWGVQRVVFPYAAYWFRSWSGKPDKSDKQQEESQIATVISAAGKLTSTQSIMLMYDGIFLILPLSVALLFLSQLLTFINQFCSTYHSLLHLYPAILRVGCISLGSSSMSRGIMLASTQHTIDS